MRSFKKRISELSKKQSRLLAFGAGMFSTLAMSPIFFWPIMFVTMPLMLWLIDAVLHPKTGSVNQRENTIDQSANDQLKDATTVEEKTNNNQVIVNKKNMLNVFLLGWSFGFGYFLVSLYWIGSSFLVEPEKFALALPFAVTLLPAGLACFYGLGFMLTALYWPIGPARLVSFAFAIFIADWLRGHILTGFPWNLIGHSLTSQSELMQSVSIFGLYGLSALAVLIFASPATIADNYEPVKEANRQTVSQNKYRQNIIANVTPTLIGLTLLLSLYGYGTYRITQAGPTRYDQTIELVLIQPNISQKDKLDNTKRLAAVIKTIDMTESLPPLDQKKYQQRIIIWPETAIPYALNNAADLLSRLGQALPENTTLITGAFHVEKQSQTAPLKIYNSLFVINHKGQIIGTYDKHHLVPFGEYLPLPNLLRAIGLTALAEERGGFQIGPKPKPVPIPNGPSFLPSICYEAIFPLNEELVSKGEPGEKLNSSGYKNYQGAQWLLNISNDAWFGRTAGPHQHAHQVKIRAVETGLPMVRVVNSGITAIYDGLGRTIKTSRLGSGQTIHSSLPLPQLKTPILAMLKIDIFSILPKEALSMIILALTLVLYKSSSFLMNYLKNHKYFFNRLKNSSLISF